MGGGSPGFDSLTRAQAMIHLPPRAWIRFRFAGSRPFGLLSRFTICEADRGRQLVGAHAWLAAVGTNEGAPWQRWAT